jgi:hypothetical protein
MGVGFAGAFLWCWILHNRRYPIADMSELPPHREH